MQYEGNILNSKGVTSSLSTGSKGITFPQSIKLVSHKAITTILDQNPTIGSCLGYSERERERESYLQNVISDFYKQKMCTLPRLHITGQYDNTSKYRVVEQ